MLFRPVELKDKELIERYTSCSNICNCDLSFANIYCWQATFDSAWAIIDGYLVIRFRLEGGEKLGYMQPLRCDGSHDFSAIIPQLAQDAYANNQRLRIIGLTDEGRATLCASHPRAFAFHSPRSEEDYIYSREGMQELRGKAYQPKRNHINQFNKLYKYKYSPLSRDHAEGCLELCQRWGEGHGVNSAEMTSIKRAFENFEELALSGGVIKIDGRVVAFTYGSAINATTFCTHAEKCDTSYTGIYAAINALFTHTLPNEYTHINREEDMGIEGLRKSKLSYHPISLQKKYRAIHLHSHEAACKELWQRVFCDDDEFVDHFLHSHFSHDGMLSVSDPSGSYVSMLHIIPMSSEVGRIAYIYGVATHPEYRARGLASKLMSAAMETIKGEGYVAAALIPNECWLENYYSRFGFHTSAHLSFSSLDNFDFGTGDSERDRSMICPLSPIDIGERLELFR